MNSISKAYMRCKAGLLTLIISPLSVTTPNESVVAVVIKYLYWMHALAVFQ